MNSFSALQNGSDIRGVSSPGVRGQEVNLSPETAGKLACAFAYWLAQKSEKRTYDLKIALGRDSRLSGEALLSAAAAALARIGVQVDDFELSSTPAMFMTTVTPGFLVDGSIMLTASHLPWNRNGMKFFTEAGGLEKADISALIELADKEFVPVGCGSVQKRDFMKIYAAQLVDKVRLATGETQPLYGLKIIVDAGNGAGGFFAPDVLEPLGADTSGSVFLEPDGRFPNHIPNPEDKDAMRFISDAVVESRADLGIIFDTDVDRAAAVTREGAAISRNSLIALMGAIVLREEPGCTIVTDSITSSGLAKFIGQRGGVHRRFKRGYRNVILEAQRLNAAGQNCPLAIETSGHGALKENYFLDDGAYLITKILIELARLRKEGKDLNTLLSGLEQPAESAEFRLRIGEPDFASVGEKVLSSLHTHVKQHAGWKAAPDNFEGIRAEVEPEHGGGWFLLRMSLHDPLMPLNIESDKTGGVRQIALDLMKFFEKWPQLDRGPIDEYIAKP